MIKCNKNKNECTIVGEAEEILKELAVICYGLLKGGFDEDEIYAVIISSFDAYKEIDKEEKNKK